MECLESKSFELHPLYAFFHIGYPTECGCHLIHIIDLQIVFAVQITITRKDITIVALTGKLIGKT